jgi:hypothetical protein
MTGSTVDPAVRRAPRTRFDDGAPFFGADAAWQNGQSSPTFTTGFSYYGKGDGDLYMLTAGHSVGASGQKLWTNTESPKVLGNVATNYYDPTEETADFASISGNFDPGWVWGSNTSYLITGTFLAQVNDEVTFDGWVSGENRQATVYDIDQRVYLNGSDTQFTYPVTFAKKVGTNICQGGDSGSPVLELNGSSLATGIATDELINDGVANKSYCGFQDASVILSDVNGRIATS